MFFTNLHHLSLRKPNPFLHRDSSIPKISFCHFGGTIPRKNEFDRMREEILQTLGMGSILTFGNPKRRTLHDFAEMALDRKEFWALKSFYVTMFFYDVPRTFREAVAYDRRFHMSWSEKERDFIFFSAQAHVYDWFKFLKHKDDEGFKDTHRQLMFDAWDLWSDVLPELFQPYKVVLGSQEDLPSVQGLPSYYPEQLPPLEGKPFTPPAMFSARAELEKIMMRYDFYVRVEIDGDHLAVYLKDLGQRKRVPNTFMGFPTVVGYTNGD